MSWEPNTTALQDILLTIRASTDSRNATVQRSVTLKLDAFAQEPDYVAYLAFVLSGASRDDDRIRVIAAYLLKNNVHLILKCSPEISSHVKATVLTTFAEAPPSIRNTAGQVIVAILEAVEPQNWLECLQYLLNLLDSPDPILQESAFQVIDRACEDYPRMLDFEVDGIKPLDYMITKFLTLGNHPNSKTRTHAIACLSYFVPLNCQSLYSRIDAFIGLLFKCASDDEAIVRRHVCQSLVLLLATQPQRLLPEMHSVADFMLYSTRDSNESVALEACEFWLTFAEDPDLAGPLLQILYKLLPTLLDCMVYKEDELLWLDGDMDDTAVVDKADDIRPRHHGAKSHAVARDPKDAQESGTKSQRFGVYGADDVGVESDEDDDWDSDDYGDEFATEWNLRKCAAAALDVLAVRFGEDLLHVMLSPLKERLWSPDWLQRECGILALGAVAEGCIDAIEPHLVTLIPYLLSMLNDSKPLVRAIACWTLGRYASWCTHGQAIDQDSIIFVPTIEGLLRMILDNNKRVQEAGCSAFATLEEDAGGKLVPYLEPILRNLVFAFNKYQHKNMLILYDAVGTLADSVGSALQASSCVEILMPALIARWDHHVNDEENIVPLLECLSSVAIAMGPSFLPYTGPIFGRCYSLIHTSLIAFQQYAQNRGLEQPDKQFIVVSLDFLSGLAQGLGMLIEPFVVDTTPNLMALVTLCLKYPQASVRQSAYALIGDLAIHCFPILRPHLPIIMQELIAQLDPEPKVEYISACNNAAWSVGEIALRYGPNDREFATWANPLIIRLIPILLHPKAPRSLHENTAVSLGRLGLMHPLLVAPHLDQFAQAWCQALYEIRDNEEKDSAFRGFCQLVQVNPAGVWKHLLWFCNAIARWNSPSPGLHNAFSEILHGLQQWNVEGWALQFQSFPLSIKQCLKERYDM